MGRNTISCPVPFRVSLSLGASNVVSAFINNMYDDSGEGADTDLAGWNLDDDSEEYCVRRKTLYTFSFIKEGNTNVHIVDESEWDGGDELCVFGNHRDSVIQMASDLGMTSEEILENFEENSCVQQTL